MMNKDYRHKILRKTRDVREENIANVLQDFFAYYNIDVNISEQDIIEAWKEITGELIFKLTSQIYVQNSCLYVKVNSPALKQELLLVRTSVLEKIQEKLPDAGLKNIYIK